MKRNVLENETASTLKKSYDLWEERPRIIDTIITSEPDFSHMVHYLQQYNQILHIAMGLVKDSYGDP